MSDVVVENFSYVSPEIRFKLNENEFQDMVKIQLVTYDQSIYKVNLVTYTMLYYVISFK